MYKKGCMRPFVAVCLTVFLTSMAFAYDRPGTITADGVRIRKEPNTKAQILGKLNSNDRVVYIAENNEANMDFKWFLVKVGDSTVKGWVYGEFIHFDDQVSSEYFPLRAETYEDAAITLPSGVVITVGQKLEDLRKTINEELEESAEFKGLVNVKSPRLSGASIYYSKLSGRIDHVILELPEAELLSGIRVGTDIDDILKANKRQAASSGTQSRFQSFQLKCGNRNDAYGSTLILESDTNGKVKRIDIGAPMTE